MGRKFTVSHCSCNKDLALDIGGRFNNVAYLPCAMFSSSILNHVLISTQTRFGIYFCHLQGVQSTFRTQLKSLKMATVDAKTRLSENYYVSKEYGQHSCFRQLCKTNYLLE
jgi:hypothetical protein